MKKSIQFVQHNVAGVSNVDRNSTAPPLPFRKLLMEYRVAAHHRLETDAANARQQVEAHSSPLKRFARPVTAPLEQEQEHKVEYDAHAESRPASQGFFDSVILTSKQRSAVGANGAIDSQNPVLLELANKFDDDPHKPASLPPIQGTGSVLAGNLPPMTDPYGPEAYLYRTVDPVHGHPRSIGAVGRWRPEWKPKDNSPTLTYEQFANLLCTLIQSKLTAFVTNNRSRSARTTDMPPPTMDEMHDRQGSCSNCSEKHRRAYRSTRATSG